MGQHMCAADRDAVDTADLLPSDLPSHSARGSQLVCSAGSDSVAAAMGRAVDLVQGNTGVRASRLEAHAGPVTCLLFDGGMLFSGSVDGTVKRWDVAKGKVVRTMEGHGGPVWCLATSNGCLLSASEDGTVRRWNMSSGGLLNVLQVKDDQRGKPVTCMVAKNGVVYCGSEDCTVRLWNAEVGKVRHTMHGHQGAVTCLLVAHGSVFSGSKDAYVRRWKAETCGYEALLDGHRREDWILALHASKSYLFSGCRNGTICQWDAAQGNDLLRSFGCSDDQHESGVTAFLTHQGADVLMSGSADGTVRLWDQDVGSLLNVFEGSFGVTCLVTSANGTVFGGQARGIPQRLPHIQPHVRAVARPGQFPAAVASSVFGAGAAAPACEAQPGAAFGKTLEPSPA